jgi:hypothetical protein
VLRAATSRAAPTRRPPSASAPRASRGRAHLKMATCMMPAETEFLCPRPRPPPATGRTSRPHPLSAGTSGHTRARQTKPRRGPRSRTRSRARNAAPTRLRPYVGEQGDIAASEQGVPPRLASRGAASREQPSRGAGGLPARSRGRPAAGAALGRPRAWEGVLACCGSGFITPIR